MMDSAGSVAVEDYTKRVRAGESLTTNRNAEVHLTGDPSFCPLLSIRPIRYRIRCLQTEVGVGGYRCEYEYGAEHEIEITLTCSYRGFLGLSNILGLVYSVLRRDLF